MLPLVSVLARMKLDLKICREGKVSDSKETQHLSNLWRYSLRLLLLSFLHLKCVSTDSGIRSGCFCVIIWKQFPVQIFFSAAPLWPEFSVLSCCPPCTRTNAKTATKRSHNSKLSGSNQRSFHYTGESPVLHSLKICPWSFFYKWCREKVAGESWEKHPVFLRETQMSTINILSPESWGYSLIDKKCICSSVQLHLFESMSKLPTQMLP